MIKGCLFALAACFVWGLIFIIPQLIEGFDALEVTLGRYLFYGLWSTLLFLKSKHLTFAAYSKPVWGKTLLFALVPNFLYYAGIVFAVHNSCPAVCALIIGISPITIAFYGNWIEKECDSKSLILPASLILTGLLVINWPNLQKCEDEAIFNYILGLASATFSLASWSWFVVANARFLKRHPEIQLGEWTTMIGMGTGVCSLVIGGTLAAAFATPEKIAHFMTWSTSLQSFLIGCAILGIVCGWIGSYFWNRASLSLPTSLAGQLTIFETIFGLMFVYLIEQRMPSLTELIGVSLILLAVWHGLQLFRKAQHKVPHHVVGHR